MGDEQSTKRRNRREGYSCIKFTDDQLDTGDF